MRWEACFYPSGNAPPRLQHKSKLWSHSGPYDEQQLANCWLSHEHKSRDQASRHRTEILDPAKRIVQRHTVFIAFRLPLLLIESEDDDRATGWGSKFLLLQATSCLEATYSLMLLLLLVLLSLQLGKRACTYPVIGFEVVNLLLEHSLPEVLAEKLHHFQGVTKARFVFAVPEEHCSSLSSP